MPETKDWTQALYAELQLHALEDDAAVRELARRSIGEFDRRFKTAKHCLQLEMQWYRGWHGDPDPYEWKGGNFAAPMRSQYRAGKKARKDIEHQVLEWRQAQLAKSLQVSPATHKLGVLDARD
jgi:hypothetical protein